jgi:hypothetical protein
MWFLCKKITVSNVISAVKVGEFVCFWIHVDLIPRMLKKWMSVFHTVFKFAIWPHERTTTAKNMGILKYHLTSLISDERCWPLACLGDLIKPNQACHQGARWKSSVSMLRVPVLALIIETSAVWPWCRRSFQNIYRGLWIIIAGLTCGLLPMIFRMVCPSCEFAKFQFTVQVQGYF